MDKRVGAGATGIVQQKTKENDKNKGNKKKRTNTTKREFTQGLRMVMSNESYRKLLADIHASGKISEQEQLWEERTSLETKIEKRAKMLHNAQERLNCRWILDDFEQVEGEIREMESEIRDIREEISVVD